MVLENNDNMNFKISNTLNEYNAEMFQCLCHIIKHNNNDNINILIKNSTMTKLVPVMYIY